MQQALMHCAQVETTPSVHLPQVGTVLDSCIRGAIRSSPQELKLEGLSTSPVIPCVSPAVLFLVAS